MGLPPHNRTAEGEGWAAYRNGSRWSVNILRDGGRGFFGMDFTGRPDSVARSVGITTLNREAGSDAERERVAQAIAAL